MGDWFPMFQKITQQHRVIPQKTQFFVKRFLVTVIFNLFSLLSEIMKWTACWYMHI